MVCHTLVILRIDTIHMYQRIAHLILSTIDVGIDNAIDALVAHGMYVHGQALCVCLARDVCHFLFRPVFAALMPVGIQWLYKSCAAFHRTVHKEFYPVGFYMSRSKLLNVTCLRHSLIHIHPTLNLVAQSQHKTHVTSLVTLLGCLIETGVVEIG